MNDDAKIQAARAIAQAIQALSTVLAANFPQQTGTATSATGGSASLPANPVGFLTVTLPNGTAVKVPYYGG